MYQQAVDALGLEVSEIAFSPPMHGCRRQCIWLHGVGESFWPKGGALGRLRERRVTRFSGLPELLSESEGADRRSTNGSV